MTSKSSSRTDRCLYWDCDRRIRSGFFFCYDHYQDLLDGEINECPGCARGKDVKYEICLDCKNNQVRGPAKAKPNAPNLNARHYQIEHSASWQKKDATADRFFVYLLKLNGGKFYAGQTRELRERLSEHRDGHVVSTAGRNPKLVWFSSVPTREQATSSEVHLKKLIDTNEREVRRMYLGFRDLTNELDYD